MTNSLYQRLTWVFALLAIYGTCSVAIPREGLHFILLKPLASYFLVALALLYTRPRFGHWLWLGMAFGTAGDLFLAPMTKELFLPGLVAFLLGHLAYVQAFRTPGMQFKSWKVYAILVFGVSVAAGLVWACLSKNEPLLALATPAYAAVITTMAVVAVARRSSDWKIAAGALFFLVSDFHIGLNHFWLPAPQEWITYSGVFTYLLAQGFIIFGGIYESWEQK